MEQSSLSLEYVKVPVAATVNGVVIDPTTDTVRMAFMPLGTKPTPADFKAADWETLASAIQITPTLSTRYVARCLVGTGGAIALSAGTFGVWLKVTDNPEIPIRMVGQLTIT